MCMRVCVCWFLPFVAKAPRLLTNERTVVMAGILRRRMLCLAIGIFTQWDSIDGFSSLAPEQMSTIVHKVLVFRESVCLSVFQIPNIGEGILSVRFEAYRQHCELCTAGVLVKELIAM